MTVDRLKRTGNATELAIRARIQGLLSDAVTSNRMVSLTPDGTGRTRRNGLSFDGKITQKVDLAKCTVEASGWSLKLSGKVWTELFATEPEETWMTPGTLDDIATTLVVASTTGFASSGYLWIDTECMSYSGIGTTVDAEGVTRGTFTGLGRGALGTLAQYHYSAGDASSGRNLRFPSVTNRPVTLEGRRVTLYAYDRGDPLTGDGVQFATGVILRDPRFGGSEWTISCDPITRVLEAELGGDLGDCRPRGIHYAYDIESKPTFTMGVYRYPNNGFSWGVIPYIARDGSGTVAPSFTIEFPSATHDGWFETQEDFVAELQAQIDVGTSGWATTLTAFVDDATGGYYFRLQPGFTAGSGTLNSLPDGVIVYINGVEIAQRPSPADPEFRWVEDASGERVAERLDAFTTYYQRGEGGLEGSGLVPRGTLLPAPEAPTVGSLVRNAGTLYIDGIAVPTDDVTAVQITNGDLVETLGVYDVDNVARSLLLTTRGTRHLYVYAAGEPPTVKLGRTFEYDAINPLGTFNLLKGIETTCAEYVNLGIMPLLQPADWDGDIAGGWIAQYLAAPPRAASMRRYTSFKSQKLLDLITPDLQLLGAYLAFDSIGRLTIKRLRPALDTDVPALRITRHNLLKDGWPTYERSPFGSLNTWVLQDGYDPIEDKSTGTPFVVRDVTAYGRNPTPKSVSVKPRSVYYGPTLTWEDARDASLPLLTIYGDPYVIVNCAVPLTALDVVLGSTVTIDTDLLPGVTGVRGMVAAGVITSREIDLYGARIDLEILVSLSGAAGYVPSALVTGQSFVSGTAWDITLSADYFRAGETAADHILAGDSITVYPFDALPGAGTERTGTVLSAAGNVVSASLTGAPTAANLLPAPGSVTWTGIDSPTITTSQADPLGGTNAVAVLDNSGSFESMRTNEVAYVSGADLRCEVWVKKDAGATSFAEIRVGFGGVYPNDGVDVNPITGAAQARVSSAAYPDIESTEAIAGWWRVRFTKPGAAGATVGMRVWPAWGTTYPTSAAGATGTVTFYAPRIAYRAWVPGATEWVLAFDRDGATTSNMKRYAWLADEDLAIDFTTDPDRRAFKFSISG